jgi:excisionase family DNA binding protein
VPEDIEGPWLGTTAAADYLGVVPRTLYRLIDDGLIPAYKFGRVIRLKREDVEAFLNEQRIKPGSLRHLYPPGGEQPE